MNKPTAFNYEDFLRLEKEHEALKAKYERCRNELCLRCGQYKMAHKGACDGCVFKEGV